MKIKRFFVENIPGKEELQKHSFLRLFSKILQDPDIFHLTRHSAAGGVANGLFIAYLPVPGHTLIALASSIFFRVNLPISFALTWVTNPFTVAPIYYLAYRIGARVLDRPLKSFDFEMSWAWFGGKFLEIWPSLLCGSLVLSVLSSVLGYGLVRLLWRLAVINKWKTRRNQEPVVKPK